MPVRCRNVPDRSAEGKRARRWTARAAARAVCRAVELGATQQEMRREMAECVQCTEDRRRAQQQVQAMAALAESTDTLTLADGVIAAVELVVRTVGRVSRFVPQARPVALALLPLERVVGPVRAQIRATQAANDAALAALRRAA